MGGQGGEGTYAQGIYGDDLQGGQVRYYREVVGYKEGRHCRMQGGGQTFQQGALEGREWQDTELAGARSPVSVVGGPSGVCLQQDAGLGRRGQSGCRQGGGGGCRRARGWLG